MPTFEDQYLDVLQNIEMAIVSMYRQHKSLLDYEVDRVLNLLWTEYRNEQAGKETPLPALDENARLVHERVKDVCEFRLGRPSNIRSKACSHPSPSPFPLTRLWTV